VISETAGTTTFRAKDFRARVREENPDPPLFKPEVDSVHPPRFIDL